MNITRVKIENHQIWIYVFSLIFGGIIGLSDKKLGISLDWTISPLIAILMFGMFAQIPFYCTFFLLQNHTKKPPQFVMFCNIQIKKAWYSPP